LVANAAELRAARHSLTLGPQTTLMRSPALRLRLAEAVELAAKATFEGRRKHHEPFTLARPASMPRATDGAWAFVLKVQTGPTYEEHRRHLLAEAEDEVEVPTVVLLESASRTPSWQVSQSEAQRLYAAAVNHNPANSYRSRTMLSTRVAAVDLVTGAVAHVYECGPCDLYSEDSQDVEVSQLVWAPPIPRDNGYDATLQYLRLTSTLTEPEVEADDGQPLPGGQIGLEAWSQEWRSGPYGGECGDCADLPGGVLWFTRCIRFDA